MSFPALCFALAALVLAVGALERLIFREWH